MTSNAYTEGRDVYKFNYKCIDHYSSGECCTDKRKTKEIRECSSPSIPPYKSVVSYINKRQAPTMRAAVPVQTPLKNC
jgi:hypothetical protein